MKKLITKEVQFCDGCGAEAYCEKCLGCEKEHCWQCRKPLGVEYSHSVGFSGSGDGYYCASCDINPKIEATPLHRAYIAISLLRRESKRFYEDWLRRCDEAEATLKAIPARD